MRKENHELVALLETFGLPANAATFFEMMLIKENYEGQQNEATSVITAQKAASLGQDFINFVTAETITAMYRSEHPPAMFDDYCRESIRNSTLERYIRNSPINKLVSNPHGQPGNHSTEQFLANIYQALVYLIRNSLGMDAAYSFVQQSMLPYIQESIKKVNQRSSLSYLRGYARFNNEALEVKQVPRLSNSTGETVAIQYGEIIFPPYSGLVLANEKEVHDWLDENDRLNQFFRDKRAAILKVAAYKHCRSVLKRLNDLDPEAIPEIKIPGMNAEICKSSGITEMKKTG